MNTFHEYLVGTLAERLRTRRVVVWHDPRREWMPFLHELRGQPAAELPAAQVEQVGLGDLATALCCFGGSFWALRTAVEPLVAVDRPEPLLIYIPGAERDPDSSVLMELELGGTVYSQPLKREARQFLRQYYSEGDIDEMLAPATLRYGDVVALGEAAGSGDGPASMLKVLLPDARGPEAIVVAWLADSPLDTVIEEKGAHPELYRLINSRLGLSLDESVPLADARRRLLSYLLAGEFRNDLRCPPPASIGLIPVPPTKEHLKSMRLVVKRLRADHASYYATEADRVERELRLPDAGIDALDLGAIDTFRFEEQALLGSCDTLLARGEHARVLEIATQRGGEFWVERDVLRRAQWDVCRLAAELLAGCAEVAPQIEKASRRPGDWVAAYARDGGWHRLDQIHRRLERQIAALDEDPPLSRGIAACRTAYDSLTQRMAEGFSRMLREASWQIDGARSQTRIYGEFVAPRAGTGPLAYLLVDSLRFEMGQELLQLLLPRGEAACVPAVASLPSITKIGMAALLPGAAAGFSLVEERGKLTATIDGTPLPDIVARQRHLEARAPNTVDLTLDDVLTWNATKLATRIKGAPLIVVRSQEIDALGESGMTNLARQVMETVIGNVARAVGRLANVGVAQFVIAADHGHLFAAERGDDMKLDSPSRDPVELHRRCWVGRGGTTPAGATRVSGADLGYTTTLDFIFPTGLGVFRAGGGLVYHHGGLSLQELIVPVVTLRVPSQAVIEQPGATVIIGNAPQVLHNRTLGITLTLSGNLFTPSMRVRPILIHGGEEVGYTGLVTGAEFDRATGAVLLKPGERADIGMMLTRADVSSIRIVVQDPATDAVLGQTDDISVQLGLSL